MFASFSSLVRAALCAALLLAAAAPAGAHAWSYGSDSDFEYALVDGKDDGTRTFSSSRHSFREIERILDAEDGPALWFARDGRSYIVRDPAVVAEALGIVRPLQELGAKQGKLGAAQGKLGAQQGKLGANMGALGARLGSLAVAAAWDDDDRADRAERRRIEEQMEELGRRQGELARLQEPLAREQAELARRQASVSKQTNADLRRLAERSIASGKAHALGD